MVSGSSSRPKIFSSNKRFRAPSPPTKESQQSLSPSTSSAIYSYKQPVTSLPRQLNSVKKSTIPLKTPEQKKPEAHNKGKPPTPPEMPAQRKPEADNKGKATWDDLMQEIRDRSARMQKGREVNANESV